MKKKSLKLDFEHVHFHVYILLFEKKCLFCERKQTLEVIYIEYLYIFNLLKMEHDLNAVPAICFIVLFY